MQRIEEKRPAIALDQRNERRHGGLVCCRTVRQKSTQAKRKGRKGGADAP